MNEQNLFNSHNPCNCRGKINLCQYLYRLLQAAPQAAFRRETARVSSLREALRPQDLPHFPQEDSREARGGGLSPSSSGGYGGKAQEDDLGRLYRLVKPLVSHEENLL